MMSFNLTVDKIYKIYGSLVIRIKFIFVFSTPFRFNLPIVVYVELYGCFKLNFNERNANDGRKNCSPIFCLDE